MRRRIFLSVVVLSALAAFAQQTNSSSSASSASASASQSTSDREPLASQRPKDFWDGDDPNLLNLITHPFANKKYVQRHVTPIRDRINELDQLTSENSRQIKDVDTRAQQGIQLASEKSSLADQHASDAATKAQTAQTAANQAATRLSKAEQMVSSLDQYKGSAQTEIRFRPGQTVLSKSAKDALDEMATPLKEQRGYIIEVRGFAPGQGQAATRSSQRMADSVVRYLVLTHNIPVYRIYTMSMGNAAATAEGKQSGGARVEVNVLKNDLVTSAQQ
jgi:outer membrane protein OmpA-like peptidoglycan-associated protein